LDTYNIWVIYLNIMLELVLRRVQGSCIPMHDLQFSFVSHVGRVGAKVLAVLAQRVRVFL
jgi:hypothetical protein